MDGAFQVTSFSNDVSSWDVAKVASMDNLFYNTDNFNSDLGSWDVAQVGDMSGMFEAAVKFDGDLSGAPLAAQSVAARIGLGFYYCAGELSPMLTERSVTRCQTWDRHQRGTSAP